MNARLVIGNILLLSLLLESHAQGTVVYDQQSSTESRFGEAATVIQFGSPLGQSFTPTLSQVGFIRLRLNDGNINNGLGVTMLLNLCANSVTGSVVATSLPLVMPDNYLGTSDFLFSTPATVTPNDTYFFRLVVQSGDLWQVNLGNSFGYTGGSAYFSGVASRTVQRFAHPAWHLVFGHFSPRTEIHSLTRFLPNTASLAHHTVGVTGTERNSRRTA